MGCSVFVLFGLGRFAGLLLKEHKDVPSAVLPSVAFGLAFGIAWFGLSFGLSSLWRRFPEMANAWRPMSSPLSAPVVAIIVGALSYTTSGSGARAVATGLGAGVLFLALIGLGALVRRKKS